MKKITYLLILFVATTFAQTVLVSENFDGATIPTNWQTYATLGTGTQVWTFGSGDVPGTSDDFTTNAAIFDDDAAGDSGQHDYAWLWYGSNGGADISMFTKVVLNYDYTFQFVTGGTEIETLNVGIWNGSSWVIIETYTGTDIPPTSTSIDLTPFLDANPSVDRTDFIFGFSYDDGGNNWGWGAGIDNVELIGTAINDYAANAIPVTVAAANSGCASPTIANNNGASDSSPVNGVPACGTFNGGDIWFSFVAPATGEIKVIVPSVGEWSSFVHAIYVNDILSNTALYCDGNYDINIAANTPDEVIYSGLTPGDTYLFRTWDFGNNNFGEVSFCIEEYDSTAAVSNEEISGLNIYPNPVDNILIIDAQDEISNVSIFNMLGQKVKAYDTAFTHLELDVNSLESGVYLVKFISNGKEISKKFVKN